MPISDSRVTRKSSALSCVIMRLTPRRASRCDSEYISSRKRMSSGDANRRSPRLSMTTRRAFVCSTHVEEVVDPFVDVEVDR